MEPAKGVGKYLNSMKNTIKEIIKTKRLRPVWYGGPLRPRNTSKFKDNSSEDNLPKEKKKFKKMKFR